MIAMLEISLFAIAAAGTPAPATQTTPPATDANQVICRRDTRIGSRLGQRNICRTRAEWDASNQEVREELERAQNQRTTQCVPTPTMGC